MTEPTEVALPSECPKCGEPTLWGYGLAGGGMGAYVACEALACDFFAKRQDDDEEQT